MNRTEMLSTCVFILYCPRIIKEHFLFTKMTMDTWRFFQLLFLACFTSVVMACNDDFISAVGDPGMRRDGLRVAIEAWNQCNEVGEEAVDMGSPRMADCFDVDHSTSSGEKFVVTLHLCSVTYYYDDNFLIYIARKERDFW